MSDKRAAELEEELERVRSELDELQVKYDSLLDEQDRKMAEMEADFERKSENMKKSAKTELDEVQADCDQKVTDLTKQLDQLRRAMAGDACGWVEKRDKSGDVVYENSESGQKSYDKPDVLSFAQTIQKMDGAADDKERIVKLEQRVKDADAKKRDADVKVSESRAETQNLRGLNKGWKESAEVIYYSLTAFDEMVAKACSAVQERSNYILDCDPGLTRMRLGIEATHEKVQELQGIAEQREEEVRRLTSLVERLGRFLKRSEDENAALRESVVVQVEKVATPLRGELAASYALLMQEKFEKETDRQEISNLWPDGWLMPSILQKYRTLSAAERLVKRAVAEEADAERKVKMDVRRQVVEASRWSQGYDEYGRSFFIHAVSGEKSWTEPAGMSYMPPPGRDQLGNVVDVRLAAKMSATNAPAAKARAVPTAQAPKSKKPALDHAWVEVQDEWGQVLYKNSETEEETWERPEEMGDVPLPLLPFAEDMDPKTRAIYSARCVITWLRTTKIRREKEEEDDDDIAPFVEGEQVDDEALVYDMRTVEVLAEGDESWTYSPADDDDEVSGPCKRRSPMIVLSHVQRISASLNQMMTAALCLLLFAHGKDDEEEEEEEDSDEDNEAPSRGRKKGPPTVPELRDQVFKAATEEEKLELNLRHQQRKVERLSKLLIDRIHEVEKEEKEALLPRSSAMDVEGQAKVASALADLEASMAAAASIFNFGDAPPPPEKSTLEEVKAPHEASAAKPSVAVDKEGLWLELRHRRLVDAALPRARVADASCREAAAEALWSGFSGEPLRPCHDDASDWRGKAFSSRGDAAVHGGSPSSGSRSILATLRDHERHRAAAEIAREEAERAAIAMSRLSESERIDDVAERSRQTAVEAAYVPSTAPLGAIGSQRGMAARGQPRPRKRAEGDGGLEAAADDEPDKFMSGSEVEAPWPDPSGDAVRIEKQTKKRDRAVEAIRRRDAGERPLRAERSEVQASGGTRSTRPSAEAAVVEQAELHACAMAPLLAEADRRRAALWEAHEWDVKDLAARGDAQRAKLRSLSAAGAANQARQAEVAEKLRALLVGMPEPARPTPPSIVGKEVVVAAEQEGWVPVANSDIDALVKRITAGDLDGQEVAVGLKLSPAQRAKLVAVAEKRNGKSLEKERKRADAEGKSFAAAKAAFENSESERAGNLLRLRKEMQLVDLEEGALRVARAQTARWLMWVEHEGKVAAVRGDGMYTSEMKATGWRAKQVVEAVRQAEALTRLQDELQFVQTERLRAAALPAGARNAIERAALDVENAQLAVQLKKDVLKLREAFLEEGRRRRWLYDEELALAQLELRRLRDLEDARTERSHTAGLLSKLLLTTSLSLEALTNAKKAEVEGSVQPVHTFTSMACSSMASRLALEESCLECVLRMRKVAQQRERRFAAEHRSLCLAQVPPAADQWMTRSERTRAEEELSALRTRLDSSLRGLQTEVAVHRRRRADADAELWRVKSQAGALASAQSVEVASMRSSWGHSSDMLKHMLDTQRDALTSEVQRYQRALAELAREYGTVKARLTDKVDHLALRVKDLTAWLQACRYDLSVETAKRVLGDVERKRIVFAWRAQCGALRAELVNERMHCMRLELWVGAMRRDVRNFTKEIWLRERMLEFQKEANDAEVRGLKYELWRGAVGLSRIGTDVGALFLFFVQRIANLAGSRRHHNEALRANGAALVLAALCRGPRHDLRRAAAKALGLMGWDGFVEQRLLGWDVKRSWALWLNAVVPEEERRLAALGLTFADRVPSEGADADVFEAPPGVTLRALIVARRQWALRNARRKEGPNLANMRLLGAQPDVLSTLVMLTHEADADMVRAAALALSVAAFHDHNGAAMGRLPECIGALVRLCAANDDEVRAQAAATLANLGYGHESNQRLIGESGALETLLDLCCSKDVDVVESSTAAIANNVGLHKGNAARVASAGGIHVLLRLLSSSNPANLLDSDQLSEVQANAAEALANVTCNHGEECAAQIHALGVAPLVLLCGSGNLQVRRHAALVIGNVCQGDEQRKALGVRGGIEALFLLCEKDDNVTRANALWALGNLAWHPTNQDRIGRYFTQLLVYTESAWLPVQANALVCLANSLFYHDRNRTRLEGLPGAVTRIVHLSADGTWPVLQEAALRALVSLSYTDRLCLALGSQQDFNAIPMLLANCRATNYVHRYSLMCLLNLASHDENKRHMLVCGAVEALVPSSASDDPEAKVLAEKVLELLADVKALEELNWAKGLIGLEGMLQLLRITGDLAVKRLAAESIAEQLWLHPEKQTTFEKLDGVELLLRIIDGDDISDEKLLLPVLWGLRNSVQDHEANRDRFGELRGVELLIEVCRKQTGAVLEASLTALVNACIGHERNCRRVLQRGLGTLIDLAEGKSSSVEKQPLTGPEFMWDDALGKSERNKAVERRRGAIEDSRQTNQALAASILQLIGPYNWVVCQNCHQKNHGGSTCANCGHSIVLSEVS